MSKTKIHYLSNAGIMLENKDTKVLIDTLNHDTPKPFRKVDTDIEHAIINGVPPYDNIDVMLITHAHSDHFNKDTVDKFHENFPNIPIIAPNNVLEQLSNLKKVQYASEANPRHLAIKLDKLPIPVTILPLVHVGKEYEEYPLFSYIIDLGKKFVHLGDAENSPKNVEALLQAGCIDAIFFVIFPYLVGKGAMGHFNNTLSPEMVYLIHLPEKKNDTWNWVRMTEKALTRQKEQAGPRPKYHLAIESESILEI